MRRIGSVVVAVLVVALTAGPAAATAQATPTGSHAVAIGTGGAVASMDLYASQAGINVLKRGGNAIDAAVATGSAMGVSVPFVAGPGGGGFMVIYLARSHRVVTLDGREACPSACTPTMFVNPNTGQPLDYTFASDQPISTGVPSMVALWDKAIGLYGRKSLAADLQPAISLARRGFRINQDFRQLTQAGISTLRAYTASRNLLLTASGEPLPLGYRLKNPDLARTYELLATHGPSYFYDGPIGEAVVQADDHPVLHPGTTSIRLPGIMTRNDLRSYAVRTPAPTRATYRGLAVYGMAPPSSGGSTEAEILNILSGYNLAKEPRVTALFHYLEASRLAYADRSAYVGDPEFVPVPLSGLLSRAFAATRRCLIGDTALSSPVAPGNPFGPFHPCGGSPGASGAGPSPGTHHTNNIVTVDKWGNIVAYTNTINFFGGSGQVVPGYGFLLNDEMTDFDFAPSSPGAYDPNLPAGGKQPRSSMGPIIVLRHGEPVFSIGAAGGSTIITTVVQTLINHVDFGMSMPAALAAPRVSQRNQPTSLAEPAFYHSPIAQELEHRYGEKFSLATGSVLPLDNYPGDATALQVLGHGRIEAVAEPVRLFGGSALALHPSRP
jgi:gamma-glutamyltranspeptidase / glutathione hydrolase